MDLNTEVAGSLLSRPGTAWQARSPGPGSRLAPLKKCRYFFISRWCVPYYSYLLSAAQRLKHCYLSGQIIFIFIVKRYENSSRRGEVVRVGCQAMCGVVVLLSIFIWTVASHRNRNRNPFHLHSSSAHCPPASLIIEYLLSLYLYIRPPSWN